MPSLHISSCHKRQLHTPFRVADAANPRYDAKETTTGKAEEPEKLGLLAEIEFLKNAISCKKPLHDILMPCPLRAVIRDAHRLNDYGGRVKKLHKKKDLGTF